jgi:hypothetical protein
MTNYFKWNLASVLDKDPNSLSANWINSGYKRKELPCNRDLYSLKKIIETFIDSNGNRDT